MAVTNKGVVDYATKYAKDVVNGKKRVCQAELNACKRHLADLKRTDLEWHPEIAEKHIRFAEALQYYDKNAKKALPLRLRGFQKFIVCSIFGWYRDGIRRYSEAYIQMARKNGKSFLNAFLCLDFATMSAIQNAQIYCAGTNFANASIVWKDVQELLDNNPDLAGYFKVKDWGDSRSSITNKRNGASIKALSGDTQKDGFLPYFVTVDEYHLHQTDGMYNVLLDGQVGLNGSLLVAITTAGADLNSPAYTQYKYAKQVLAGTISADHLFCYIAELALPDPHMKPVEYDRTLWDKKNWALANPLLLYDDDYKVTKDPLKWQKFTDMGDKAKELEGSTLSNFLIKKLNVWTTVGSDAFVSLQDWASCGTHNKLDNHKGRKCCLGIDLSSKNDLASISLVFPEDDTHPKPYVWSHSYLPKATLTRHIRSDKAPYDTWARRKLLTLTDCAGTNGFILDYKYILSDLRVIAKDFQVIMVGYDPMGISGILQDLAEIFPSAELVEIVQNPKSMNDATRHFRATVQGRGLEFDIANELMSHSIVNAQAVLNSKQELLIDKKSATKRIDPIDAVLDAWKCSLTVSERMAQAESDAKTADDWLNMMNSL